MLSLLALRSRHALLLSFVSLVVLGVAACDSGSGGSHGAPPVAFELADLGLDSLPPCARDADCAASARCEPLYDRCVECIFDADCDAGSRCDVRRCVSEAPCTSDAGCASDPVGRRLCKVSTGQCVGCLDDGQCGSGSICSASRCVPGKRCVNSLDCGESTVCDRNSNTCVACVVDADCGDGRSCAGHQCRVDCESDHDCVASGALCDTSRAFCVECVQDEDCPGAYHCDDAACVLDVCVAGESQCTTGGFLTCLTDGRGFGFVSCADQGASCTTGAAGPTCTPWSCTPSAKSCDPATHELVTCATNGLSSAHAACASGTACDAGACLPTVCTPNATFCATGDVRTCNASGTGSQLTQDCGSWRCDEGTPAHCSAYACTPGQAACVDGFAGTCNAAGTGLDVGGTDCAATNATCASGQCVPHVCEPSTTFCSNNNIYSCSADGLTSYYSQSCYSYYGTKVCTQHDTVASCDSVLCTPGAASCQGNAVVTCNAAGTAYENPTTCTGFAGSCVQGQCKPTICVANTYYCEDDRVMHCDATGASTVLSQTCYSSAHCDSIAGYCVANVCTPGGTVCDGNTVRTCNDNGSGPTGASTACGAGTSCSNGSCVAQICTPGAYQCAFDYYYYTNSPQVCRADGLAWESVAHCSYSQLCVVASHSCETPVCGAGQTRCNGSTVETCSADRLSWQATTDCAATSQICAASACISQQIDTIASGAYTTFRATNALRGAYVQVTSDRSLTRIEASLSIANGTNTTLTWVVYESMTEVGPFLPIATQDTSAAGTGAFVWYGSNPLTVTLRAGRYYAIGVLAHGAASYAYTNTSAVTPLSFGSAYSGVYESGATPPAQIVGQTRAARYTQRLTVGAPPP